MHKNHVRARKSPWIETGYRAGTLERNQSGLVRARGLKLDPGEVIRFEEVRARKSPWIETEDEEGNIVDPTSGLVRARGLKLFMIFMMSDKFSQGS